MSIDPITAGLNLVNDLIDRFVPDKQKNAEMKAQAVQAQAANDLATLHELGQQAIAQLDVDKTEAGSASLFVAGWRPFVGWCCGAAFAYAFVLQPLAVFACTAAHWSLDPKELPSLDISSMMPVLLGMLGLGAMRTYEKQQGVAPPTHG